MKRFAIFIGIDDYSHGITPLHCACNDASDLALKFAAAGFDKIELVKENEAGWQASFPEGCEVIRR
ncbi:MAG: hypothetical protein E7058_06175 [Lentisphaerae bacterium]|nr:hypothetical protein [Lentisphaerota bacterium]